MRRYQIIPLLLVGILCAGGGTAVGYALGSNQESAPYTAYDRPYYVAGMPVSAATTPPALSVEATPIYVLGTDHGFVAVFNGSDRTLMERTTRPESALSPEERARLASGIHIYTEEQLVKALQDYGS